MRLRIFTFGRIALKASAVGCNPHPYGFRNFPRYRKIYFLNPLYVLLDIMGSKGTEYQKPKHEVLDPLDVVVPDEVEGTSTRDQGKLYAFTLNPQCAIAPNVAGHTQNGPRAGFADIYTGIRDLLVACRSMYFQVVPEVSKHGRIHVHGWCVFNDVPWAYVYDIPLLESRATICIKEIEDPRVWEEYVYKSHNLMVRLTHDAGLPYVIDTERMQWDSMQSREEERGKKLTKAKRSFLHSC